MEFSVEEHIWWHTLDTQLKLEYSIAQSIGAAHLAATAYRNRFKRDESTKEEKQND